MVKRDSIRFRHTECQNLDSWLGWVEASWCFLGKQSRRPRANGFVSRGFLSLYFLYRCWLGCCLIPCCIPECMITNHSCPNCKAYLGRYSHFWRKLCRQSIDSCIGIVTNHHKWQAFRNLQLFFYRGRGWDYPLNACVKISVGNPGKTRKVQNPCFTSLNYVTHCVSSI